MLMWQFFANLTIWKEQLLPHCLWLPYIILMLMCTNVLSTAQLSVSLIVCAIKPSSLFCEKVGWVFCEKVGWVFVLSLIMLVLHILHPSALLNIVILCNVHLNQEEDVYNNRVSLSDRINASSLSTSPTFTQKDLSSTLDDRLFQLLFDKTSPADKASLFFLILSPQASSWLSIIPSVSLGLHLEPDELVLSIGLGLHLNQMSSLLLFGGARSGHISWFTVCTLS